MDNAKFYVPRATPDMLERDVRRVLDCPWASSHVSGARPGDRTIDQIEVVAILGQTTHTFAAAELVS
jgi:hypothetical protein